MPCNGKIESLRQKLSHYTVNTLARDAAIVGNFHKYSPELQKYRENQEQSQYYYLPCRVMEGWTKMGQTAVCWEMVWAWDKLKLGQMIQ